MMKRGVLSFALVATLLGSRTDYLSAQRKFQQIEKSQVKPGARIQLSSEEINSYVAAELPKVAPSGIRNPKVVLRGANTATGYALIDFIKLRSAQGKPPGWLLRQLLQGEHEVSVQARVRSGGGSATVDLQSVEVAGVPISGAALDFLIQNYVLPNYPEAKIGRPFKLHKRVDSLEVQPGTAFVVIKR
ncbi:MAG: hypothetical protein WKF37_20465 [Bryobacteraceae bacterium]